MNIHTELGDVGLYITNCIDQYYIDEFIKMDDKQDKHEARNCYTYRFMRHLSPEVFDYFNIVFSNSILEYLNKSNKNPSDYLFPNHYKVAQWKQYASLGDHKDSIAYGAKFESTGPRPSLTSLAYLTDNYQGGEIYFSDMNIALKPELGSMIVFESDTTHGVKTLLKGDRRAITYHLHSINSPHIEELREQGYVTYQELISTKQP